MPERPERYVNAMNRNPRSKLGGERSRGIVPRNIHGNGGGWFKYMARPKKWRCFSCFCWSVRCFFLDVYIFSHVFLCWCQKFVGATLRLSNLSFSLFYRWVLPFGVPFWLPIQSKNTWILPVPICYSHCEQRKGARNGATTPNFFFMIIKRLRIDFLDFFHQPTKISSVPVVRVSTPFYWGWSWHS